MDRIDLQVAVNRLKPEEITVCNKLAAIEPSPPASQHKSPTADDTFPVVFF